MITINKKKFFNIRYIATTGILGAFASVLMLLNFPVPFLPSFIKFDFSELPALIAAFSMGPLYGVAVCLIKHLVNLPMTMTGGVGELSNFILGCCLVLPAGLIDKVKNNRWAALISALIGSAALAIISLPSNYFVTFPAYAKLMPVDLIIEKYAEIFPGVVNLIPNAPPLFTCLLLFNVPFTFLKGLSATIITFLIYKKISPIIKGVKK